MNQTLLTLGAVALFMYLSINIHRGYMNANRQVIDQQKGIEALNYSLSLSDELSAQSFNYDSLGVHYGNFNDPTNINKRMNHVTQLNDTLVATINLSAESNLIAGARGKIATIRVYSWEKGISKQLVEQVVPIVPFK